MSTSSCRSGGMRLLLSTTTRSNIALHHQQRAASLLSQCTSASYSTNNSGSVKARKRAKEMSRAYVPEMTQHCFDKTDPYTGTFRHKIQKIDIPDMLNREKHLSRFDVRVNPPFYSRDGTNAAARERKRAQLFQDVRKMSQSTWLKSNKREQLIGALKQSDMTGDLFKGRSELVPDFDQALYDNLQLNCFVYYPSNMHNSNKFDDNNTLFDNALFGNYIEVSQLVKEGEVHMVGADPAKLYTMIMVCPDHPSRVNPDGHMVHWMVANIPGGDVSKGDIIKSYLPPLPTECAGAFRYAFVFYEQSNRIDNAVQLPKEKQDLTVKMERQKAVKTQKLQQKEATKRAYLNSYPYEREYWEELEKRENEESLDSSVDPSTIQCSDYIPPAPSTPCDEKTLQEFKDRQHFDLDSFVSNAALFTSPLPVGLCFLHTDYDFCVSQKYDEMGIQEPFYIPIDFVHRVKKHEELRARTHVGKRMRDQWN